MKSVSKSAARRRKEDGTEEEEETFMPARVFGHTSGRKHHHRQDNREEEHSPPPPPSSSPPLLSFPISKGGAQSKWTVHFGRKKMMRRVDSDRRVKATNKSVTRVNNRSNNFVIPLGRLSLRSKIWLYLFISTAIATGSFALANPRPLRNGMHHIALLCCSIDTLLSFLVSASFRHMSLRDFLVRRFNSEGFPDIPYLAAAVDWICMSTNQTLEVYFSIVTFCLWCVAAAVILNMENSLAIASSQVWSSNLYFSSWISLGLSSFLTAELITTNYTGGVVPPYFRATNQVNRTFSLLFLSSLALVAFAASQVTGPLCEGSLRETDSCKNCVVSAIFGILAMALICFHFILVVTEKTSSVKRLAIVNNVLCGASLIWFTLHAGIVTTPGGAGSNPNIFVASWICFGLSMYLCVYLVDVYTCPNRKLEEDAMKIGFFDYYESRRAVNDDLSIASTTNQYTEEYDEEKGVEVKEKKDDEDYPSVSIPQYNLKEDTFLLCLHAPNPDIGMRAHDDDSTLQSFVSHNIPVHHIPAPHIKFHRAPSKSSTENAKIGCQFEDPPTHSSGSSSTTSVLRTEVINIGQSVASGGSKDLLKKQSSGSSVPSIDIKRQATDSDSEVSSSAESFYRQAHENLHARAMANGGFAQHMNRVAPPSPPPRKKFNAQESGQAFNRKDSSKSDTGPRRTSSRGRAGRAADWNASINLGVRSKSEPDQSRPLTKQSTTPPSPVKDPSVREVKAKEPPALLNTMNLGKSERKDRVSSSKKMHTPNHQNSRAAGRQGKPEHISKGVRNRPAVPPPPRGRSNEMRRDEGNLTQEANRNKVSRHKEPKLNAPESPTPSFLATSDNPSTVSPDNGTPSTTSPSEVSHHLLEMKKQELLNIIMTASDSSSANSSYTRECEFASSTPTLQTSLLSSRKQQIASEKIWEALEIAGYTGSYKPPEFGNERRSTSSEVKRSDEEFPTSHESNTPSRSVSFYHDADPNQDGPFIHPSESLYQETGYNEEKEQHQIPIRRYSAHVETQTPQVHLPSILKKNLSSHNMRDRRRSSAVASAYSRNINSFYSYGTNIEDAGDLLEPGGLYAC